MQVAEYPYLLLPIFVVEFNLEIYAAMVEDNTGMLWFEDIYYKVADEYQEVFKNALEWVENN